MKWFLFFVILFNFSCNNNTVVKTKPLVDSSDIAVKPDGPSYVDSFPITFIWSDDTGYFKNLGQYRIDSLEEKDPSPFFRFIDSILDKRQIILLNRSGLTHSCRISADSIYRTDTFTYGKTSIIQKGNKLDEELSFLKIDGHLIKVPEGNTFYRGELFNFDESSFRHFIFNKKEYYYISATLLGYFGTSMGNVCFHLLYDLNSHHLNLFTSCRFEAIMFGDANGDDRLDFLDFDNSGMCTTVPSSSAFTIQLYSDNGKGNFALQKDKTGKPYFIDGDRGSDFAKADLLTIERMHWPVRQK